MDAIKTAFSTKERNSDVMTSFGFRMRNQFSQNKAYRRPKELQWLEDLRAYKGLYDPDVVIDENNSKVYPKIVRSKVNIVLSRLHEMLFPETDKNWEMEPTPEPRVDRDIVTQIAMSLVREDPEQPGVPIIPTEKELRLAIKKFVEEACGKMASVVDDQLIEMDYPEETKKVLRSGLMYGTGIMKGPLVGKRTKRRWEPIAAGEFKEVAESEDIPDLRAIRLWDWYPDMTVTELENAEGSYERHVMTKHDLRQLIKRPDFYGDIITEFLRDHPNGDYVPLNWEVDLQVIEVEAGSGKQKYSSTAVTGAAQDDNSRSTNRQLGKKYEVLEYWGYVDGQDLSACGIEVPDVALEYAANVWVLGNRVIKANVFPGALDQYKLFYYEKDETSIFGEGLCRVMRGSALAIGAAARMVLDNASCCAGPQVEINWSLMTPDTDINSIYPRKIWFREGKGMDAQYPALRVYNIDSHIQELLTIVDAFKQFGDEETTLPTWMIGQMVNNETAQATSGRMATITVSIKDVVKNFDTFTEKIMRDIYAWNMEFNPRKDIKGDFNVKARGVSSLVMKEIRMQALTQLTTTLTPEEWAYVPKREFLMEKFKAHDILITLLEEEEVAKLQEAQQNSIQMQLAVELQKSEIAKNKAQSLSLLTKAKEHNVNAIKESQTPPEIPPGQDPRLQDAELAGKQTEIMGKQAEIRRQEERHAAEMARADESHTVKKAIDTTKTAQDIAIKGQMAAQDMETKAKMTEHDMKMKEHMTKASAEAKKTAAKQKKPAAKAKGVK